MRVIGGFVIAVAIICSTISVASAFSENTQTEHLDKYFATNSLDQPNFFFTTTSSLADDAIKSETNSNNKFVYEIVLIPNPCDPLSNMLFLPDDPNLDCKKNLIDQDLLDFINEIAIKTLGFPIDIDDILFSEFTDLAELEEQILELETISELIFEHENIDVSTTTQQFEEQIQNSEPEAEEYLETKLEEKVEEIRTEYQIIKDKWKEKVDELQNNSKNLLNENAGMKAKILNQNIEKIKIRFDLKDDKVKNSYSTTKKIQSAIELSKLKKNFQDSMIEYKIIEKTMKYGTEKYKKLAQLEQKNMDLFKSVMISEAKHNGKKLDENYLKNIDQNVSDLIKDSDGVYDEKTYGYGSEIIGSGNGNGDGNGNGSDKGKGSGNGKGSDKGSNGKGSDKGKSSSNGKSSGKGNSKK